MRYILLATAVLFFTACGGGSSSPTSSTPTTPTPTTPTPTAAPPSQAPAAPAVLAMFADPGSSFSTSDVRDSDDQIVQFDTASQSMIWAADGRRFEGFPVLDTYFVRSDKFFQVRFGTRNGERRAYFTEAVAGTICNVEVSGGGVVITATSVRVPTS
jgi:hypothetical protein